VLKNGQKPNSPGAIHVIGEYGVLEEVSAIDGRLHLLHGGEVIVLAVYLETPGRSGGVRHREAKLAGRRVEQRAQQCRLAGARRPADHQQPRVLSHHFDTYSTMLRSQRSA